jgi:putative tryptophan/tyrosine transport system substrate-binding protein
VFYAGSDPVAVGLVESFRKPGGRLTGIHSQFTELTAKRLELLKEMIPRLRRVVTFYRPDNPAAQQSVKIARDAAHHLKVELVERPVASVEALRAGLRALRPGDADALFQVADSMVMSQSQLVIDAARAKRLPTMFASPAESVRAAVATRRSSPWLHQECEQSSERPYVFSFRSIGNHALLSGNIFVHRVRCNR